MDFPSDQIEELRLLCPEASRCEEGGSVFFLLPAVALPPACEPAITDLLLCPTPRDGYPSRLFFAEAVKSSTSQNWHVNGVRIIERNWHAFSWRVTRPGLRLAQLVSAHLRALR
jgi:hypothetical protein